MVEKNHREEADENVCEPVSAVDVEKGESPTEERLTRLERDMARVVARFEKAQRWLEMDAEVSLGQARKAAEAICKQIYVNEGRDKKGKPANKMMLNDLIGLLSRERLIPQRIGVALGTIQAFGNLGAHDQGEESDHITTETAAPCLHALSTVVNWYTTEYHEHSLLANQQNKKHDDDKTFGIKSFNDSRMFSSDFRETSKEKYEISLKAIILIYIAGIVLPLIGFGCAIYLAVKGSLRSSIGISLVSILSCFAWAQFVIGFHTSERKDLNAKSGETLYHTALNLLSGKNGVEKNLIKGMSSLSRAAEQGDDRAQALLGLFSFSQENFKEASKWLIMAAEQGNIDAQVMLGVHYLSGDGVAKDEVESAKWLLMAADQRNSIAQFLMGLNYYKGEGVAKDTLLSIKYLKDALEQGPEAFSIFEDVGEFAEGFRSSLPYEDLTTNAYLTIGLIYYSGDGVPSAKGAGIEWLRKAAEQGDAEAQVILGIYSTTADETLGEAAKWFRKAADQGASIAQFFMGLAYYEGEGVTRDTLLSIKYLKAALQQGREAFPIFKNVEFWDTHFSPLLPYEDLSSRAQLTLGLIYYSGDGVPIDKVQAIEWFRKAAEQGNAKAQFNLGSSFYSQKDTQEAVKWFRKAAEQGNIDAQSILGALLYNGNGISKSDQIEAVTWLRKAAEQGDQESQFNLGAAYYNGKGVTKSLVHAYSWFMLADSNGHNSAKETMKSFESTMSPEEILKAKELSESLIKNVR